jgi:hypothetical protein
MHRLFTRFGLGACAFALVGFALADDGAVSWSGSPQMLNGHPTVSLVSEKIVLKVHWHSGEDGWTDADCNFVFHNHGPACSVRIGFPDRTQGANEPNFSKGGNGDFPHPTFQVLQSFKSWVDGKRVVTRVVPAQDPNIKGATYGGSWHVKVVHFKANQTLTVRDTYRQPQSGGATESGVYLNQVQYILLTGGSWRGPIGSVEVDVHLDGVASIQPLAKLTKDQPYGYAKWKEVKPGHVFYTGFTEPKLRGWGLEFKGRNLKPTLASDINIYWPNLVASNI